MDRRSLYKALCQPECYPESPTNITHIETHISHLFFTDQHVYKVKKPVDFGFLNFTSLDRRRFYCEEEIRLNRRFCAGIYLKVAEIRRCGNRIRIDGEGDIIDYAVVMQRLPAERMLEHLLEIGDTELPKAMDRLASRLARLHQHADICRGTGGRSDLETIRFNWQENLQQMAPFVETTLTSCGQTYIRAYVERFLADHSELILQREDEGLVRDGHGDLHAQNICLTEKICIYDCIEFNQRFRVADLAADVAFLLMDLDFRDRRDLAGRFWSVYLKHFSKPADWNVLLPFYKVYRAYVRGKVNTFLAADTQVDEEERMNAHHRARRYFNLALGYLGRPAVILTCGLMGAGKTSVARPLAKCLDSVLLRSDEIRKGLAGLAPATKVADSFQTGLYAAEMTERTYDALLERAMIALRNNRTVIIDASFAKEAQRGRFRAEARQLGVPFLLVYLTCDQATLLARLDQRMSQPDEASDGRRELLAQQAAEFEIPHGGSGTICIDALQDVDYNVTLILCALLEQEGTPR